MCRDRNGRTGRAYPYSGKEQGATLTHKQTTPPPNPHPPPPRHPSSHYKSHALPNAIINREREKKPRPRRHTEGGTGYSCPPQTRKAHTINRNLKTITQKKIKILWAIHYTWDDTFWCLQWYMGRHNVFKGVPSIGCSYHMFFKKVLQRSETLYGGFVSICKF